MGGLRYSTGIWYSVDLKTLHTFIEMAYFPISISTFGDIQKGNNFENKTILLCLWAVTQSYSNQEKFRACLCIAEDN